MRIGTSRDVRLTGAVTATAHPSWQIERRQCSVSSGPPRILIGPAPRGEILIVAEVNL